MRQKGISTYAMINKYGIPASTIHSLRHNGNINMLTLEKLCSALECTPDCVVKFEKDDM
ncbi:helix-turn-helix transcriptional regulator [Lachnospiraceae bacterium 64-25]